MATVPEPKLAGNGEMAEVGNVMKIREILFGSQMRDYEKRVLSLEDRLMKETRSLRDDVMKRIDGLEAFCKEEFEAQQQRFKLEKTERSDTIKELARELKDTGKTLEKRLGQIEEDTSKTQTEFRSRVLEQSKTLSAEIESTRRDITSTLDQAFRTLREEKTDRAQLGDLFTELGMRLRGEFELPGEVSKPSSSEPAGTATLSSLLASGRRGKAPGLWRGSRLLRVRRAEDRS